MIGMDEIFDMHREQTRRGKTLEARTEFGTTRQNYWTSYEKKDRGRERRKKTMEVVKETAEGRERMEKASEASERRKKDGGHDGDQ